MAREATPEELQAGVGTVIYNWDKLSLDERRMVQERIDANPGMEVMVLRSVETKFSRNLELDSEALLPPDLVENYSLLWGLALRAPKAVSCGDPIEKARGLPVTRLSTGQTETRGGAKGSKKSGKSADFIGSEAALVFKGKIDRKLRKVAREVKAWLEGSEVGVDLRRCSVCRQYGDSSWLYCPKDGKPMVSAGPNT